MVRVRLDMLEVVEEELLLTEVIQDQTVMALMEEMVVLEHQIQLQEQTLHTQVVEEVLLIQIVPALEQVVQVVEEKVEEQEILLIQLINLL
jgi:hypothetical protein